MKQKMQSTPPTIGLTAGLLLAAATVVAGCGGTDVMEEIGAVIPPPDEFAVLPTKPLVIPATAQLPTPQLGAPSPLEPDPTGDAIAALAISSSQSTPAAEGIIATESLALPGEQADIAAPAAATQQGSSNGERALLAAANASASREDIRVQLEVDRVQAAEPDPNEPYEAPTIWELFNGKQNDGIDDPESVLEPTLESQRLQRGGVRAPNNPNAEAVVEAEQPEPVTPIYSSTDRRPSNALPSQSQTPKFE